MTITLETLSDATAQEVFVQIATHMLTQGQKCGVELSNGSFVCYYSRNGMSCAAGCLIAPEEYDEDFEYLSWHTLVMDGHVPPEHADLIERLQYIHDDHEPARWYQSLDDAAFDFDLNPAVLEHCKPKA